MRAGTSVGANNSEATSAISKADYKSKSYIALKEARESLYWIELLYRNKYLDDSQYKSKEDQGTVLRSGVKLVSLFMALTKRTCFR